MAELEGAREGDPVEEEWSVERVLDKRVKRPELILVTRIEAYYGLFGLFCHDFLHLLVYFLRA